jgi:elongation factor G
MKAYRYENSSPSTRDNCSEIEIPAELADTAEEYREKLMDEICEVSDSLMERYLEGEEIAHDEIVAVLKDGTNHGSLFPVVCGVATRNLATNRLLDAIVEDLPSPVKHGSLELPEITLEADEDAPLYAYVFKTRADPFAGRINLFRVYQGVMRHDTQIMNTTSHNKERIGQLLVFSGKESGHADEFGPGDIGAVAKLKETRAGDWLAERDEPISMPAIELPAPVMAFAIEAKGDEDKVFTSLRRLQEEDPTIDLHRDEQTGDQIVAGLSQMHVEVIVDRLKERFGAEVVLKPPRVPYQETIRKPAKAHGRHKKQSGGRGQFGDCHIEIEPRAPGEGFEFVNRIKGGVIPTSFIPAVEKGVIEAMRSGPIAGCPIKDVRVTVFDGSYHTVDSSEMAFKLAGSIAMKEAMGNASPALLEPIMLVTLSIPEESVGDVIGDLNSRRGRPQGMDSAGAGLTEVKAEVPMAEMLTYAPDLRSLTGGRGDYAMAFERYDEVPSHLQQKIVAQASEEEAVSA